MTDPLPDQGNPLADFLRDYLEATGGLWDQVEPQVYDLLLPQAGAAEAGLFAGDGQMIRAVFDPEALPEHPGSQFVTLGTPLLDQALEEAQRQGAVSHAFLVGLNTQPFDLPRRLRRALDLPAEALLQTATAHCLDVPVAIFWFAATYLSDQREQELFTLAVELGHGREVRHLQRLLDPGRLAAAALEALPPGPRISALAAYQVAREQVLRSLSATANIRRRQLEEHFRRQETRMAEYYQDLLEEMAAQEERTAARGEESVQRLALRRAAAQRERDLRLREIRQKGALRVHLRLVNYLEVHQPKLLCAAHLQMPHAPPLPWALTWDPLLEALQAPDCPACARPTFRLRWHSRTGWHCPACPGNSGGS